MPGYPTLESAVVVVVAAGGEAAGKAEKRSDTLAAEADRQAPKARFSSRHHR